jgi:D-3-phosphoglycerate dehydrogenase
MYMKKLIWIIDEEWPDYDTENEVFKNSFDSHEIRYTGDDYVRDFDDFGHKADAIICQINIKVDAAFIDKLQNCKLISVYGSGYNNIDIEAAKRKRIPVAFVPGYCALDIAEYVLAAILYANKSFGTFHAAVAQGLWGAQTMPNTPSRLYGQELFIVGFGRIGKEVAKKALAIGLSVSAYDPYVDKAVFRSLGAKKVEFDEGLMAADYVSIHSIFNSETTALFSVKQFRMMKKSAVLINASRGGVINQDDLIHALNEGVIAGAILDVLNTEPPLPGDPVLSCNNLLLTPHISYLSKESLAELQRRAAQSVADVLNGKPCSDLVPGTDI